MPTKLYISKSNLKLEQQAPLPELTWPIPLDSFAYHYENGSNGRFFLYDGRYKKEFFINSFDKAIDIDNVPFTSKQNLIDFLDNIGSVPREANGGIPVNIQDQVSRPVFVKFNRVENSTTLAVDALRGDTSITVTSSTGIVAGKYMILFNPTILKYFFGYVADASGAPVIILDSPLDSDFPAGTFVDSAETNLKSIGTLASPTIYGLRGTGAPPGVNLTVDITRLIFSATASSGVDLTKFINLAKLINGLVLRRRDGDFENIFNIKSNQDLASIMYDLQSTEAANPNQGIDGLFGRLTFAGQDKLGVAIRLPVGDDLELLVQDDIQTAQSGATITNFEIMAQGHLIED